MKNAFPILWRYLLVVAISCGLAFLGSKAHARDGIAHAPILKHVFKPK